MSIEKFIIDTDIGDDIDDAYAIAYLSQEIKNETLGITTVFKNAVQRAKLAAYLLKLLEWDIPVAAGESKPLKAETMYLPFEKPSPNPSISQYEEIFKDEKILDKPAVDFILDSIKENDKVTLICIGPLTNIALAIQKDPITFEKVNKLVIMGGCFTANYVEWNIKCDPEAFEIVLNCGAKIEMVGHEITKYSVFTQREVNYLKTLRSKPLSFLEKITSNYLKYYDYTRLPCMHDSLTVSLLNHKFVKMKNVHVKTDMNNGKKGVCIVVKEGVPVRIAYKAHQFLFRKHLIEKLKKLNRERK